MMQFFCFLLYFENCNIQSGEGLNTGNHVMPIVKNFGVALISMDVLNFSKHNDGILALRF